MAYVPYSSGGTTTQPKATGKGYVSYYGNKVMATQQQGGSSRKSNLSNDEQVKQATEAGQKLGQQAKQNAKPSKSLFSKAKDFVGDNVVKPVITTAEKSANTVAAGVGSAAGLGVAGVQAATGHKEAAKKTIASTNKTADSILNGGVGGKGGFISANQASSKGGGGKGLKENFIKPTTRAVADVAPLVVPVGKAAKGASLLTKVVRGAAENAAVGAGSTAAAEAADGHVNAKDVVKSGAAAGLLGGAVPVAGKVASKVVGKAKKPAVAEPVASPEPKPGDIVSPEQTRADLIKKVDSGQKPSDIIANQQAVDALEPAREQPKLPPTKEQVAAAQKADEAATKVQTKAVEDTKKIDNQIELLQAKRKDAPDGKLSNVDQTKLKQLNEQKANIEPIASQGGSRPLDELQTAIEQAHNSGNKELEAKLVAQIPKGSEGINPNGGLTPERRAELMAKMQQGSAKPESTPVPKPVEPPVVKPSEGTAGDKYSRAYQRLQAEQPETLNGDVKYQSTTLKNEAQKATDLVAKDKNEAYRVAMGHEPKSDVTSTSVNIVLADKALEEGNYKLYADLTRNRSLRLTRLGQEIVSEKASVTDNSASRYVKELISSRLSKLGGQYLNDIKTKLGSSPAKRATEVIDREVAKAQRKIAGKQLDLKAAQDLIDKLAC